MENNWSITDLLAMLVDSQIKQTQSATGRGGRDGDKSTLIKGIKKPDAFKGEPAKLRSFLQQLRIYILANDFRTERKKVLFAASRLRDHAESWFGLYIGMAEHYKKVAHKILDFYPKFIELLKQTFSPIDKADA